MKKGFTLIELVMVIVILGILAATALPRFLDLSGRAKSSAVRGTLGGIRASLAVYYASMAAAGNASYPGVIDGTLFADGNVPRDPLSNQTTLIQNGSASVVNGAGGWVYDSTTGRVWINSAGNSTGQDPTNGNYNYSNY